jgi:hypothetical protein
VVAVSADSGALHPATMIAAMIVIDPNFIAVIPLEFLMVL